MEFLSGFETLDNFLKKRVYSRTETPKYAESMARYEIAKLYHLGYIHGDLHTENLLIHPTYHYFDGIPGRVILIDFGSTFKLEPCKLLNIERDTENKEYYALDPSNLYQPCYHSFIIDSPGYPQGTALTHGAYQWLKVTNFKEENKKLKDLHNRRVMCIEKFKEHISREQGSTTGRGGTDNIFDTLDPDNMLTRENIQTYITSKINREYRGGNKSKSKKKGRKTKKFFNNYKKS
jgi:hypothetical protein